MSIVGGCLAHRGPESSFSKLSLVGASASHRRALELIEKVGPTDAEVMVLGPSGVGKELYARRLHECSRRSLMPFVGVNCGAVPSALFENEFFGHAAGAFTGAKGQMEGLFAQAEGGTLFLDEVDALSRHDQVKLLRVLQEREYRRLGESQVRKANVRIVSASNAALSAQVRQGSFREDLYFRLHVFPVTIEPLHNRRDDIEPLITHYAEQCATEYTAPLVRLSDEAREALLRYDWPGNVRELQNCVRYLTCLQLDRPVALSDLPLVGGEEHAPDAASMDFENVSFQEAKDEVVEDFERAYLQNALRKACGNVSAAARASGKHRRAFFELMRKHQLDGAGFKRA